MPPNTTTAPLRPLFPRRMIFVGLTLSIPERPPVRPIRMARPAPPEVWMIHIQNGCFQLNGQDGPVTYRLANPRPDLPPRINGIARMHRDYPGVCEVHTYGQNHRLLCEGTAILEA